MLKYMYHYGRYNNIEDLASNASAVSGVPVVIVYCYLKDFVKEPFDFDSKIKSLVDFYGCELDLD